MSAPAAAMTESAFQESTFTSKDGTRLFHVSLVPAEAKAVVVVVHGYADHSGRYRHVMEAFAKAGFASHALDYRGHGRAAGRRGFCNSFEEFLDDLSGFLTRVRAESGSLPLFLVAHSHGALITARLLATRGAPERLAGVMLSAPYFRLQLEPSRFQLFQAKVIGKLIPFLPVKNPLTVPQLTNDPEMMAWTEKDVLRHAVVTPKWFTESNAAQDAVFRDTAALTWPILVVHGAEDPVARPDASKTFFDALPASDKEYVSWPGMLHEPFTAPARQEVLDKVVGWMDARVPA